MARSDKATTKPKADLGRDDARQQPGAQGAGTDAVDPAGNLHRGKLKQNQKRLQVDADHKTSDMRKKHRGTFP